MKIGLTGNYGHTNLGDEALLLGAITLLNEDVGIACEDIVILSDNESDTRARLAENACEVRQLKRQFGGKLYRFPLIAIDIYRSLRGLDWLVFGGGGLLNDSNRSAIPLFVLIRILAWFRGVRIAWWSIGLGPLEDSRRRSMASWLLKSSDFVCVRDHDSASLAKELCGRSFQVVPDLAHTLATPALSPDTRLPIRVAMSVIPYGKPGLWFSRSPETYTRYCEKIVVIIEELLGQNSDLEVSLFAVSLRQDAEAIQDVLDLGGLQENPRVNVFPSTSVADLMDRLASVTFVVATRLHSTVLSTLAGVPCITIAYQPKVKSYVMELPTDLPCFDIEDFSSEEVVTATLGIAGARPALSRALLHENEQRRDRLRNSAMVWSRTL